MDIVTGRSRARRLNLCLDQFAIPEIDRLVPGVELFHCLLAAMNIIVRIFG